MPFTGRFIVRHDGSGELRSLEPASKFARRGLIYMIDGKTVSKKEWEEFNNKQKQIKAFNNKIDEIIK